jgi:hypothetical protein
MTAAAIATMATVEAATITPASFPLAGSAKRKARDNNTPSYRRPGYSHGQPKLASLPGSLIAARA